jgi:hypothetical protein
MRNVVRVLACLWVLAGCQEADGRQDGRDGAGARVVADVDPASRVAVEIRSYDLAENARTEFDRLMREEGLPLLERWEVDVVAYGPSTHDATSYFLIRSFHDVAARQSVEDAFYGSDEWREGPRDAVLALIDGYTTVVLELEPATLEALRADLARPGSR